MARLEELTRGASVKGILPDRLVTVVDVKWFGSTVVELTYKDATGHLGNLLLYRDDDFILAIVEVDGDTTHIPRYIRRPFQKGPDFGVMSVNYNLEELLESVERSRHEKTDEQGASFQPDRLGRHGDCRLNLVNDRSHRSLL